jgi:hypothetical protein
MEQNLKVKFLPQFLNCKIDRKNAQHEYKRQCQMVKWGEKKFQGPSLSLSSGYWCVWSDSVRVTLRLTVGQSVSQSWCRAPSGTHDQILILYNEYYGLRLLGTLSLTRGWVCHLSEVAYFVTFPELFTLICTEFTWVYTVKICTVCTRPLSVQALWSRSCLILLSLCYDDSSHQNGRRPDRRQV